MNRIGGHAVVIGASIGGLLAARILSDFYDVVTVLERDTFPEPGEQRKGVPQARHAHGLLARGREILEELFPGFTGEMVGQGGLVVDMTNDFRWFAKGGFHQSSPSGLLGLLVSRPRLEAGLRARLLSLPNVRAIENCDVPGIVATEDHSRVTGVRMVRRSAGADEQILAADLVVDASGRGSRTPAWLAALGYEQAPEERVKIDLGYTSCEFRRRPEQSGGGLAIAAEPPRGRTGVMLAQEQDRWHVTVGGYNGDFAPTDLQGFLDYAKGLPSRELYDAIKDAEPLNQPVAYKFAANQRRHYEQLKRFPDGLLVYGDAVCSFNPIYGQGMTVAAMETEVLRHCLAGGSQALASRFFKAASKVIDAPWNAAVGNDLTFPHVEGRLSPMARFINWYIGKLHVAAQRDASLSVAFLRVVNMIASPSDILQPRMVARIVRGNLRPRAIKAPAAIAPAPAQA